jgi:hypothetical protein
MNIIETFPVVASTAQLGSSYFWRIVLLYYRFTWVDEYVNDNQENCP